MKNCPICDGTCEQPKHYERTLELLREATIAWFRENPTALPILRLPPEDTLMLMGLDQAVSVLAGNDDARRLLLEVDAATHRLASALQMVAILRAIKPREEWS